MSHKNVVVLRGGPSSEFAVSMKTGQQVLTALQTLGYHPRDIVVTKQGEWLEHGIAYQPAIALSTADTVFIAMHGEYGEDGTVQRICERLHIPFTGSNSFASGITFNKHATKNHLANTQIKTPQHMLLTQHDVPDLAEVIAAATKDWHTGLVIKPVASGSSHGIEVFTDVSSAIPTISQRLQTDELVMAEERIVGTEATCGLIENFRDESHYMLPAIEIIPPADVDHFNAEVKYNGQTEEICPGRFSYAEKTLMEEYTKLAHRELGLSQYSRADFIIRAGQPYFLEINSLPGLTTESLFPKAAKAVGLEFGSLIQHLVDTAKVW